MTDLRQLAADLDELREHVDCLTARDEPSRGHPAAARVETGGAEAPARNPHVWHTLTRRDAAIAWETLLPWVDWLTARYQLEETLPDCWYRHGALVDELDALQVAWTAAYRDPAARAVDAVVWHELFVRALARIRGWDRYGCAAGSHRGDPPPGDREADLAERASFVEDDIAGRVSRPGKPSGNDRSSPSAPSPRRISGTLTRIYPVPDPTP